MLDSAVSWYLSLPLTAHAWIIGIVVGLSYFRLAFGERSRRLYP